MDALWIVATLLVAGVLGWPVTLGVLRLARTVDTAERRREHPDRSLPALPEPPSSPPSVQGSALPPGVLRGGLMIGVLERLAVAVSVLAGEPVGIAYVVAVKALGRYAELKQTPEAAERFIIGTLTSLVWAAGVATLVRVYVLGVT